MVFFSCIKNKFLDFKINCLQKAKKIFILIGGKLVKETKTEIIEDPSLLSWQELDAIVNAKNQLTNAKSVLANLPLNDENLEIAILNIQMWEKKYIVLLKEAKASSKHCSMVQCAWWSLMARKKQTADV